MNKTSLVKQIAGFLLTVVTIPSLPMIFSEDPKHIPLWAAWAIIGVCILPLALVFLGLYVWLID